MLIGGGFDGGKAGNASWLAGAAAAGRLESGPVTGVTVRGAWCVAVPGPPTQSDCAVREPEPGPDPDAPGKAGKAGDEDAGEDVLAGAVHVVPGTERTAAVGPADGMLPALPRRVLFFNFSTRVVCF